MELYGYLNFILKIKKNNSDKENSYVKIITQKSGNFNRDHVELNAKQRMIRNTENRYINKKKKFT